MDEEENKPKKFAEVLSGDVRGADLPASSVSEPCIKSEISDTNSNLGINNSDIIIIEPESGKCVSTDSDIEVIEGNNKIIELTASISESSNCTGELKSSQDPLEMSGDSLTVLLDSSRNSQDSARFSTELFSSTNESSDKLTFDVNPVISTPKDLDFPRNKLTNDLNLGVFGYSTDSLTSLQPFNKSFSLLIEISTLLHLDKSNISGELVNVSCEEILKPESSGQLSDCSKSTSPSSVTSHTLKIPFKLNRFSQISSSSSSSAASSAGMLAAKMLRRKKIDVKLTDERVKELKEKWLNSVEIYKVLDYIDRVAMNIDNSLNDENVKLVNRSLDMCGMKKEEKLDTIKEIDTSVTSSKCLTTRAKRNQKVKFTQVESDSEVPKKRQRLLKLDQGNSKPYSFSFDDTVFAKWTDRKFYAGTVQDRTPEGKWLVKFFDGNEKYMFDDQIIKADEFTLHGFQIYASHNDNNYSPGIITGCEFKNNRLHFNVLRDTGDVLIPPNFMYITESQARNIRGKNANANLKNASRTYDSPLEKRCTRSKSKTLVLDNSKPSSSGTQQRVLSDSDDDGNESVSDCNVDEVAGVEPESHGVYENGIKLKGKSVSGKNRFTGTKANDIDAKILGPLPEEGSKFFKNFNVLLTCTRPHSPKFKASDSSGSGIEYSTDSEFFKFSNIPFVKNRLKLQLEYGGAVVYAQFSDIPSKIWKNTFLISNRPSISAKYIQCIAAGIKFICHEWVIRCCVEGKRLPIQELPLGWSLERQKFVNACERTKLHPLRRHKLLIVESVDKNYFKFWMKVCKLAGALVDKLTRDSNLEDVAAVICECGYRDDIVDRAVSYNIPVVTSTWLVQSLIHGEIRPFEGHKNYLADYVDSD